MAAANGQFLMVQRTAYFQVGGHAAVAGSLLEDVDLAFLLKRRKYPIRFRYAPDALSTRMYRSFGAMIEGWTKNLARLFGYPLMMAAWRALDLLLIIGLPLLLWHFFSLPVARYALAAVWLRVLWRFYARVAKSNFSAVDCALSVFALAAVLSAAGEKLVAARRAQPGRVERPGLFNLKKMKKIATLSIK